jgi:hypothetical protein
MREKRIANQSQGTYSSCTAESEVVALVVVYMFCIIGKCNNPQFARHIASQQFPMVLVDTVQLSIKKSIIYKALAILVVQQVMMLFWNVISEYLTK